MRPNASRFGLAVLFLATVALACGQRPASESASAEAEELAPGEPATGQISGRLQDADTGDPVAEIDLALMIRGEGEGPLVPMEQTDFTARSDAEGGFLFENVPPNRYLFLADFGPIRTSPNVMLRGEDGTGITIELAAGEVRDLGVVLVTKE